MLLRVSILVITSRILVASSCTPVTGDYILVSDLAKTQSGLDGLNPDLVYSFAPSIGNPRNVAAADIENWAIAHGINDFKARPACFERTAVKITAHDVEASVKSLFPDAEDLQVDVIEICNCVVPHGALVFASNGTSAPPPSHPDFATIWHGNVISDSGKSYPIWVRLRVFAKRSEIRAVADLPARQPIRLDQIEETTTRSSPLIIQRSHTASEYVGMIPSRSVKRGETLDFSLLSAPLLVERGSIVRVNVIDGAAELVFEAKAETSGRAGDTITLQNPTSQERFHARVTGPGTSEIVLGKNTLNHPNTLEKNTSVNPTMPKKSL